MRVTLILSTTLLSLAFRVVCESPRWLLAVHRYDGLTAVLARVAEVNGVVMEDAWGLVHCAEVVERLQVLVDVEFAVVELGLLITKLKSYECFPSAVRATAVTTLAAVETLGLGTAQFLGDVVKVANVTLIMLATAMGLLFSQLATRWLPENKSGELPELPTDLLGRCGKKTDES